MSEAVLGLNLGHDRASCLVVDGEIRVAIAEERLSRKKHETPVNASGERFNHLPERSIEYCLEAAGIELTDLELVAASTTYVLDVRSRHRRQLETDDVRRQLPGLTCPVMVTNHHLAHAASAVAGVGDEPCAVLVVDGGGSIVAEDGEGGLDFERTSIFSSDGTSLELEARSVGERPTYANSLGDFYMMLTEYLGFRPGEEGKLMALASYGRCGPSFEPLAPFKDAIRVDPTGHHCVSPMFQYPLEGRFPAALLELYGPPRDHGDTYGEVEYAVAASAQWALEEAMLALAYRADELCGHPPTLTLAGGVGLNCVANGRILREGPFERLFVQPAASDDGTALGNAALGWRRLSAAATTVSRPRFTSTYLGRTYGPAEVIASLARRRPEVAIAIPADVTASMVADLEAGKVVALFRGGCEFGPRALGHRSILCDPRSVELRNRLNAEVKHRELFRPFAPMTTQAAVEDHFEPRSGDPYMMLAGMVLHPDALPAITHVDGTSRVQVVETDREPFLHGLLEAFGAVSGIPVLLNTSFNDQGPIVETPDDALDCFLRTGIDVLYLEGHRVERAVAG